MDLGAVVLAVGFLWRSLDRGKRRRAWVTGWGVIPGKFEELWTGF